MDSAEGYGLLRHVKSKLVDSIFIVFSILSGPLLIASIARGFITGWKWIYSYHIIVVLSILIALVFRKKLSLISKTVFLSLLFISIAIVGMYNFGFFAGGIQFFILTAILASLFLGEKYGYIVLGIASMAMIVFGLLFLNQKLTYNFELNEYIKSPSVWISMGMSLALIILSSILIISNLEKAYKEQINTTQEKAADLRFLFDQAAEGILLLNSDRMTINANISFLKISGYTLEELVGKKVSTFFSEDVLSEKPLRFDLLEMGQIVQTERLMLKKTGELVEIEMRTQKLPDGRFQSFVRDITDENRAKKEIEEQKLFSEAIIKSLPGIFYVFEDFKRLVQWNRNFEEVSGYRSEELLDKEPFDFIVPNEHEQHKLAIEKVFKDGYNTTQATIISKTGNKHTYFQSGLKFERNDRIYLLGIGYDISDRLKAEKELDEKQEFIQKVINIAPTLTYIYDVEQRMNVFVNEAGIRSLGYTPEYIQTLGADLFPELMHPDDLIPVTRHHEEITKLNDGEVKEIEYRLKNNSGDWQWMYSWDTVFLRNADGEVKQIAGSAFDISERKRLEREVYFSRIKSEETERGRIARELHDGLGPLLSTCRIYLHKIKTQTVNQPEQDSVVSLEELIDEALNGIKEISNNISPHILRNFGLIQAVKNFIDRLSSKIDIKFQCKCELLDRFDDIIEVTIYRVITELLNNTIKYSKANQVNLSLEYDNAQLDINYSDDGVGFDFENMYGATKGFGLINIHSRIKSIGGQINYISTLGNGVEVSIQVNDKIDIA